MEFGEASRSQKVLRVVKNIPDPSRALATVCHVWLLLQLNGLYSVLANYTLFRSVTEVVSAQNTSPAGLQKRMFAMPDAALNGVRFAYATNSVR